MTTIADMVSAALRGGICRSPEYRRGVEDALRFKLGGQPIRCPYKAGTAQADAYHAGAERGRAIHRTEARKVADAHAAQIERRFFADADAL